MIIKINYDKSTKQIVVSNDVKQIVLLGLADDNLA